MFSDAGPDVRWCGNERGTAGDPNWSTVDPSIVTYPGADGPKIIDSLQHGDPHGTVWRPSEVDVSIRPGWFYHPAEDSRVRSVDDLVGLYFSSVGRNSKLLLNVPPTRDGLLHSVDVSNLTGFRQRLTALFERDVTDGGQRNWRVVGPRVAELEIALRQPATIAIARLQENIARGQRVASYTLSGESSGGWHVLSRGTTIGYTKLDRFEPTRVSRVRLSIDDAVATPEAVTIGLY
jgi:alpha-L-fucosidase